MRAKDALGRFGEQAAAEYLLAHGLQVLARNWRCEEGELDIVARDGAQLVVVEVKTRSSRAFGEPAEAVGVRKAARLRRLAVRWLADTGNAPAWASIRFDVLGVLRTRDGLQIEHLRGVL